MGTKVDELLLSSGNWHQMIHSISECLPEEGCGLLAGISGLVREVIPLENIEHSPIRYRIAPQDQLTAFLHIEETGLELLGIYHSHPDGPETLSETDIAEAYYPEAIYIIVSRTNKQWKMRGFSLKNKTPQEIRLKII